MEDLQNETGCCPRFEPEKWDGLIFDWKNKQFIRETVRTFFYMPLNFGCIMKKVNKLLVSDGLKLSSNICLSDPVSMWKMMLYVEVEKTVNGANNIALTGQFLCKVYEGDFKQTGEWTKDFDLYAKSRSIELQKIYLWYTTCPKCAKVYGSNYVAIFGQIK